MHVPVHADWQQTPCAQMPLAQSGPMAQAAPSGSFPQLVPVQTLPPEQSALVAHMVRQLVAPQTYGRHVWLVPGTQLPPPSQRAAGVSVEPLQVWLPQVVPAEYSRQAPAPLQEPSVPQPAEPVSAHWASGSCPAAIGVQTPTDPVRAHDMQMPVQDWLQQTPCWQKPDWHSPPAAQVMPFGR